MAQRLDGFAGRIKGGGAKRGETLVETIVAFAVLMLLLTMAITIVRGGIALNNRASANLAALYADCSAAELGSFALNAPDDTATLTLTCAEGTTAPGDPASYNCTESMQVYKGDMLYTFKPENAGEVTGG